MFFVERLLKATSCKIRKIRKFQRNPLKSTMCSYVFDFSNRKFHRISPSSATFAKSLNWNFQRTIHLWAAFNTFHEHFPFCLRNRSVRRSELILSTKPQKTCSLKKKKREKNTELGIYSGNETPFQIPLITRKVSRNKSSRWKPFEIDVQYAARRGVKKIGEWTRCLYTCLHAHYKFPLKLPSTPPSLLFLITFLFVFLFYFYFISSTLFLLLFFSFLFFSSLSFLILNVNSRRRENQTGPHEQLKRV